MFCFSLVFDGNLRSFSLIQGHITLLCIQILVVMAGDQWQDDRDSQMYRDRVLMSLMDRGVEVYSIGVGPSTSTTQVSKISSGRRYWFLPSSYNDLDNVRPRVIQSILGGK